MIEAATFDQIFRTLNPAQKRAVETIDGPVMVIAGPGTGKTQILAARIANILLKTDTNPSSILALTFTESAATTMRERLVSMIGKTGYYVQIQTFHAFCTEIIATHSEYFSINRESQPLTDLERYQLFETLFDELQLDILKPLNTPYFYLRDSMQNISDLKRESISVSDFQQLVAAEKALFEQEEPELKKGEKTKRQKLIQKNTEFIEIYSAYQERLQQTQRYDFEDMISLVKVAFTEHPDLLLEYQEKLLYFLVDEYQDTNASQNQVVDLLTSYWGDDANIFVVGDPNQAIYRFQGASIENVISFTKRYPTATVITLETGYRSPQIIYTAAADLIKENQLSDVLIGEGESQLQLNQTLASVHSGGEPIEVYKAPSQTLESVYIAERVKALIASGIQPQEIAVLYRNNADVVDFAQALSKWGIRFQIDGGNNILAEQHICQLLNLLKVIHTIRSGSEDGLLYEVMQYEWVGLDSLLVMKAARAASKGRVTLIDMILKGYSFFQEHEVSQVVSEAEFNQLVEFVTKLQEWGASESNLVLSTWFTLIMTESGYLPWILNQSGRVDLINGVNSLYREVVFQVGRNPNVNLVEFLTSIQTLQEHNLAITKEDLNVEQDAVHLSTVHKAKGKEWLYVFLVRCVDGKWGNVKQRNILPLPSGIVKHTDLSRKELNEDDRRLFYVALTRAKQSFIVTYPETVITGNRSKETLGSVFVEEIKTHTKLVRDTTSENIVNQSDVFLAQLLEPVTPRDRTNEEKEYFRKLVKDLPMSVTTLNTYLKSPELFIREILLKVPTIPSPHFAFGTAMHRALEAWNRALQRDGAAPALDYILDVFTQHLSEQPHFQQDYEQRLKRGREVLTAYYHEHKDDLQQPLFIERQFGYGFTKTYLNDVSLTGRVDRVDWKNQAENTAHVIDYKTGKPRTEGEIEATTASSDLSDREKELPESIRGPYKRQLLFYKLLADLDPSFTPTVETGSFVFVQPDSQNKKFITRTFVLTDESVNDLKQLIQEVMSEIRSLAFLD